jgi:hypothetical protein
MYVVWVRYVNVLMIVLKTYILEDTEGMYRTGISENLNCKKTAMKNSNQIVDQQFLGGLECLM